MLFEQIDIRKLDKESLLEIIFLNNSLSEKNFLEDLIKKLNLFDESDKKLMDIQIRIDIILKKFLEKKYIQKISTNYYNLYEYEKNYDLYFCNSIDIKNLNEFIKNLNFEFLEVSYKNKTKYQILTLIKNNNFNESKLRKDSNNFLELLEQYKLNDYNFSNIRIRLYKPNQINNII